MPQKKQTEALMNFLIRASKELNSTLDYKTTLQNLSQLVIPDLADWFSIDLINEEGEIELVTLAHADPSFVKRGYELRKQFPPSLEHATAGLPHVLQTGVSELYDHFDVNTSKNVQGIEFNSAMIVPLKARDRILGALTFVLTKDSGRIYRHQDLTLAEELAQRAAIAIDNAYLYKKAQQEIAERKKSEQRLLESENRFKVMADTAPVMIWLANENRQSDYYNKRYVEFTGLPVEELSGSQWKELMHPNDRIRFDKQVIPLYEKQVPFQVEFRLKRYDGEYRWILNSGTPRFDPHGNFVGYIGSCIDITDRKKAEKKKDEFISIASHELKTPLTSVKAFTQLLSRYFHNKEDEKAINYLNRMENQLKRLTVLVEDLLDVSKIQAGKLIFKEDVFVFDEIIEETIAEIQPTTEKHTILKEGDANIRVFADRYRIGQVITNLLTNAIKYSPQGKIIVKTMADQDNVTVAVQDFGIGIPKIKQAHIFQRFYRVDGGEHDSFPGLGLGLYISSEIMKRHHGKMWVESKEGDGSTFYFTLPITLHSRLVVENSQS